MVIYYGSDAQFMADPCAGLQPSLSKGVIIDSQAVDTAAILPIETRAANGLTEATQATKELASAVTTIAFSWGKSVMAHAKAAAKSSRRPGGIKPGSVALLAGVIVVAIAALLLTAAAGSSRQHPRLLGIASGAAGGMAYLYGSAAETSPASAAACARVVACSGKQSTGGRAATAPSIAACARIGFARVPTGDGGPSPIAELPLAAWTQLRSAAIWTLHFRRGCRGSTFPLRVPNAQFASSSLMGQPALQALYGFTSTPFLAYTGHALTQVPAALLCSTAAVAELSEDLDRRGAEAAAAASVPWSAQSVLCWGGGTDGGTGGDSGHPQQAASRGAGAEADALLAALWLAGPESPALPVRLAPHVAAALSQAAAAPDDPGSALLRLLLQGSATPAAAVPSKGLPAACLPAPATVPMPVPGAAGSGGGCSLQALTSYAAAQAASAATASPVRGLLHNASALVDALWAPPSGEPYSHVGLGALAAAAATADARAVADALAPLQRSRALPSVATFFNVAVLSDGALVSLDELLLRRQSAEESQAPQGRQSAARGGALDACSLEALRTPEPAAAARCRLRAAAAYLAAAASKSPLATPDIGAVAADCPAPARGPSDDAVAAAVAQAASRGRTVLPLVYSGEVAADAGVAARSSGRTGSGGSGGGGAAGGSAPPSSDAGAPPRDEATAGGWRCGRGHALDRQAAAGSGGGATMMRASGVLMPYGEVAPGPPALPMEGAGAPPLTAASARVAAAPSPAPPPHPHPPSGKARRKPAAAGGGGGGGRKLLELEDGGEAADAEGDGSDDASGPPSEGLTARPGDALRAAASLGCSSSSSSSSPPIVDLGAPLPEGLPVYDDVLLLPSSLGYAAGDRGSSGSVWPWVAESAGGAALLRDWLASFPHAVVHFDLAAARAWSAAHEDVRHGGGRQGRGGRGTRWHWSLTPTPPPSLPRPPGPPRGWAGPAAGRLWASPGAPRPRPRQQQPGGRPPTRGTGSIDEWGEGR